MKPNTTPIRVEKSTATPIDRGDTAMVKLPLDRAVTTWAMPTARATPMAPPSRQTSTASMMNWFRMSLRRAPTAMRTPISLVRSVTDTSMMFITPMPPTISEIRAMEPIRAVSTAVVALMVLRMVSVEKA